MNRFKLFIPLIIFVVMAAFLWRGLSIDPNHLPSALIDKPVPAFDLPNLLRADERVTNADLAGKPYLLNVWATWCPSCRIEHPFLNKLAGQGVAIVGLNYKDENEPAREWLKNFEDPYIINIADQDGRFGLDLGVYGAPETFVVDAEGIIRYKHVGVVDERVWRSTLAPIFNQ
ncbi:DsbE family thiol:disulfide interchange protein [Teredinibacter purpureus]|uniref:DsbE family thiol:disulfide interchange protein n=1 Tax=Teredinibacter purpureus TaxID=2731756 RepID=UPI0005F7BFDD|nr:DsbE family thiol:disulfide interchange protein [Teredinibacter purpureus]